MMIVQKIPELQIYGIGGFHITCRFETFVFNILDNFKLDLGC